MRKGLGKVKSVQESHYLGASLVEEYGGVWRVRISGGIPEVDSDTKRWRVWRWCDSVECHADVESRGLIHENIGSCTKQDAL